MPYPIEQDLLPIASGSQLRYSLYRQRGAGVHPTPLLICLHPGWSGQVPSPHYGEQFLSSMFIPAFVETGAIIASPDCPSGAWNNSSSRLAILGLIDHLVDCCGVDQSRVSLAGYSAGGWGAWYLLQLSPGGFSSSIMLATLPVIDPVDRFEENFPKTNELLAGRLDEWIGRVPDVPIYIIHSQDDELMPYANARLSYGALVAAERQVELHSINGVSHFDADGYIGALRESRAWLMNTWRPSART
jgi:predicted peptidase